MGVERQTAKVNWITSLAMVVMAGTFYRFRNLLRIASKWQVKDLREKAGHLYERKQDLPSILPHSPKTDRGAWERVLQHRNQYRLFSKLYTWSCGSFRRKY
jgi:hypothetical protein